MIGRFISPDSLVPDHIDVQSHDRFSYCQNNPLKYVDPSGHEIEGIGPGNHFDDNSLDRDIKRRLENGTGFKADQGMRNNPFAESRLYEDVTKRLNNYDQLNSWEKFKVEIGISIQGIKFGVSQSLSDLGAAGFAGALLGTKVPKRPSNIKTLIIPGTKTPLKKGAPPNSIYVQKTPEGDLQSINYYDEAGNRFSMEHYNQKASHKLTIDGKKVNLKNTPHEHQTRVLEGPNGPYKKKQVRILDENGKPTSGWVNEK